MNKIMELVSMFNLEEELEKFVKSKVEELTAKEHTEFYFSGTRVSAPGTEPCVPGVVGSYSTVRYGGLEKYHLGREGVLPDGRKLHIIVTQRGKGSPDFPSYAKGYWFVTQ